MVLWCFNVTVPDLVSLRCYQRLKPQTTKTKNKKKTRWAPSFGFSFLLRCCLRGPVYRAVSTLSRVLGLVFHCSPWWPKLGSRRRQLAPCKDSSGPLVGLSLFLGQIRKGAVALRGRGGAPASPCVSGILVSQGANPRGDRLWSRGSAFTWPRQGRDGRDFGFLLLIGSSWCSD